MQIEDSKLIQLLKSLDKSEFKKLENYVNSPFFNTGNYINQLFKVLVKKYPKFDALDKDAIYQKVYPGEPFNDKRLRDLFFAMSRLVEEFLAQIEFMKRDMLINRFTLRQLAERNLEKHFVSKSKEYDQKIAKQKIISTEYFFNKYSVLKEKRNYLDNLKALGKRSDSLVNITNEIDLFVIFSVYKILKYALNLQITEKVLGFKYDFKMLESTMDYLKAYPMKEYPVIMIYYFIIILNRGEADDSVYFELIKLLDANFDFLEEEDQRVILVELFNYTKIQAIKGKRIFKDENYRILKESIEKGLHPMEGDYFPESSYITIVGTGLQEKDFEWTENFMNKYKEMLPPEQRENAYTYCRSILNYRLGKYGEALKGLARVSIDDFFYQLRVKNHELKIYYETGDYESALRIVDTYRHFLSTNKHLPEYVRIRFTNYVNFFSRILNTRLSGDTNKLLDIKNELNKIDPANIENKLWLLDQINKVGI